MAKHPFLSDEWFTAVTQIVNESGAEVHSAVSMNLTITDTPFGGSLACNQYCSAPEAHSSLAWGDFQMAMAPATWPQTSWK